MPATTPDGVVVLLTDAVSAPYDTDLDPLVAALSAAGLEARVVAWDDDDVDWDTPSLVVIRSTWSYTERLDDYLVRLRRIAARTALANPLAVVEATVDKGYLLSLVEAGVPVVPTEVVRPGQELVVPRGTEVVVKPTVSAGARDTGRYGPSQHAEAEAHARSLLDRGRAVLVQPYLVAIDEVGETGLVFVGDRFSHAFRKEPLLHPHAPPVGRPRDAPITPREPTPAEREVAEAALDAVAGLAPGVGRADLLYARVDLVPGPGGPVLMELELIEPSLYLHVDPTAPARTAAAIADRLAAS